MSLPDHVDYIFICPELRSLCPGFIEVPFSLKVDDFGGP